MMTTLAGYAVVILALSAVSPERGEGLADEAARPEAPRTRASTEPPPLPRSSELADQSVVDLAGPWLFHAGDNDAFAQPSLDDLAWEERQLPTAGSRWRSRWQGYGWYRLHLLLGDSVIADWALSLGPAREAVEVYVNGALVGVRGAFGARPRGAERATPFVVFLPARLLRPGDNVVAVRVYDPSFAGGFPFGPLLLGAPAAVAELVRVDALAGSTLRLAMALLALCVGLAHLFITIGRRSREQESWWLVGAALGVGAMLLDGTGVLALHALPLELLTRLPVLIAPLVVLCVGSYLAARFDDPRAAHVVIGRLVLLSLSALLLLLPAPAVFFAAGPAVLVGALVTALYGVSVAARATRRSESHALISFAALVVLVLLLVYDGLDPGTSDLLPPWSLLGALVLVVVVSLMVVRRAVVGQERALAAAEQLQRRIDEQSALGVLEATAMSITNADAFLDAVMHEAARELAVRRCSLVVASQGGLEIRAAAGLPRQTSGLAVPQSGSIAGYVYARRVTVSDRNLPSELAGVPRAGQYVTRSFISQPVVLGGACLGVLNVSDRLDGSDLTADDELAVAEVAHKLALVLTRLGDAGLAKTG